MFKIPSHVVGLWVTVAAFTLFVVKMTAIGPVILTISAHHGWGIHLFDLVVFPVGFVALVLTYMWTRSHNSAKNL